MSVEQVAVQTLIFSVLSVLVAVLSLFIAIFGFYAARNQIFEAGRREQKFRRGEAASELATAMQVVRLELGEFFSNKGFASVRDSRNYTPEEMANKHHDFDRVVRQAVWLSNRDQAATHALREARRAMSMYRVYFSRSGVHEHWQNLLEAWNRSQSAINSILLFKNMEIAGFQIEKSALLDLVEDDWAAVPFAVNDQGGEIGKIMDASMSAIEAEATDMLRAAYS